MLERFRWNRFNAKKTRNRKISRSRYFCEYKVILPFKNLIIKRGYRLGDKYAETIHEAINKMPECSVLDLSKNRLSDLGTLIVLKGKEKLKRKDKQKDGSNTKK